MKRLLGNEELKEHFKAAIRGKKISHAYLIEGEKGSGKKLFAETIAGILQCEAPLTLPEGPAACGNCNSCIMVKNRNHPDVIWVTHEKPRTIAVSEVRTQLVNTVDVIPYKGPYKIYIIDEAEKMNEASQNAILKTIEEPPDYAVILLLSANQGAFLPTILSRCVLLNMKPVPDELVKNYLMRECGVKEELADFCAGFAMGNIGKAKEAAASEEFGELREYGIALLRQIHELEIYEITERIKGFLNWQGRIEDYLDIMLIWFRDLLVLKAMDKDEKLILKGEYYSLRKQSELAEYWTIHEIIKEIGHTRTRINVHVNFANSLEVLHIKIRGYFR